MLPRGSIVRSGAAVAAAVAAAAYALVVSQTRVVQSGDSLLSREVGTRPEKNDGGAEGQNC
jgi:hypothetical protein